MLQRANELFAAGRYEESAAAFEQLARAAEARRGPRAPWLLLQAGGARLAARQADRALPHFRHGLGLLIARGGQARAAQAGSRVLAEMRQRGNQPQAEQLEAFLKELLPDLNPLEPTAVAASRLRLPTHCPSCGAAMRPDELEWLDAATAECAYCGSPVHGER